MKHEMHVEFTCRRCGKTETLIFLEPVNADLIRKYVTPPDWGWQDNYKAEIMRDLTLYTMMINDGVPCEDARYVLPQAFTCNIMLTMNARELRHFFSLRCCTRAQWEIRELANEMLKLCKEVAPVLFADAGPGCVRGHCPEGEKSCGRGKQHAGI